jgi:hypothetical protein
MWLGIVRQRHLPGQVIAASVATAILLIIPQAGEIPPLSEYVEVTFWSYEREDWRLSDQLEVDPSDPSPVGRVAKSYTRKGYSLYDKSMQSLSPAQSYRAATIDGNNAIFIASAHEEKLATDGRPIRE